MHIIPISRKTHADHSIAYKTQKPFIISIILCMPRRVTATFLIRVKHVDIDDTRNAMDVDLFF